MTEVKTQQVYAHYKGGEYVVLFVADESTNARVGNSVVVYMSLTYGKIKCRDLSEFVEEVEWPDGSLKPRFVLDDTKI